MPACSSENSSRFWSSSPPISRSQSVSPSLPSSPLSTSPPLVSPVSTLKRYNSTSSSYSEMSSNSSTTTIIYAPTKKYNQEYQQQQQQQQQSIQPPQTKSSENRIGTSILMKIFICYVNIIFFIVQRIYETIGYAIWAPALWASAWIYLFWIALQLPLTLLKWFITILHTPASERTRHKRCVLISGGSTVQSVHLARNFYKAGARVVICELDGLFGLSKFSTACSKFYTIPRPTPGTAMEYVKALQRIVDKEKAVYYIPVSASNTAYYDALAKPYLENLGCECFVPGANEVTLLNDPLELLRRCRLISLPTPTNYLLRSVQDLARLYEQNTLRNGRYIMLAAGPAGMREPVKILLPSTIQEFVNQQHEISERKPWVVVRDPGGEHFVTCTTVKQSKIVANVSCKVDQTRGGLVPEDRPEILQWLEEFFARSYGSRINGHISFRFVIHGDNDQLVPMGCRVGVTLPYVCHTGVHARLVWRPCRHFSRQNSEVLNNNVPTITTESGKNCLKRSNIENAAPHLLGSVIDKRETLFVYWDPLPYCAYYHLQLPFQRVAGVIRAQPSLHKPPLAAVVQ